MQSNLITKIIDYSFKLVSEASLSFYGAKGTGLGAVLLAVLLITIIIYG